MNTLLYLTNPPSAPPGLVQALILTALWLYMARLWFRVAPVTIRALWHGVSVKPIMWKLTFGLFFGGQIVGVMAFVSWHAFFSHIIL